MSARSVLPDNKTKTILISIAAVIVLFIGVLIYLAVKANEDNKIAALKYNFNKYYPSTYNTVEELDPDADYDGDGINNSSEKDSKTRIVSADSDNDGLIDADETNYGTDPLNADSDGDGIKDGVEVRAHLDPLSLISDGHTKDEERTFIRYMQLDEANVTVMGKADIYAATLDKLTLNAVASNAGAISSPYEFHCDGEFDSAELTINFNAVYAKAAGYTQENIRIYKFDPYLKKYNTVGGDIDVSKGKAVVPLKENGVYLLGAENIIHDAAEAYGSEIMNVHILIDNSGSMYPKSYQSTSKENDVEFKRLAFAKNFVTALDNSVKFSISVFTYEFRNLIDFTADKSRILPAISSIKQLGPGFDGTSVERAAMLGLESFGEDTRSERNIIILLTDGISTDAAGFKMSDIVSTAKGKNVTIMTIGLGDEVDTELLSEIASATGGSYYPISEASVLEGLYSTMIASMEDDIVDDDFDGTPDSYTLFDTGFDPDVNGFSFQNFKSKTNGTLDFGMVTLARDWFRGNVRKSLGSADSEMSYTFEGTTISTTEPLRKVMLQLMQEPWIRPDDYLNFLSGGKVLKVKSEDAAASQEKGWVKSEIPYTDAGTDWEKAEILVPNHTASTIRTKYSENDYEMLRAIHYYELSRDTGESFNLSSEAELIRVKSILANGTPIVTKIIWQDENGSVCSRFVLMTMLRRDLENPNIFKIKVYDVNSKFISTIIVNRTIRVNGPGDRDFTYTANWDNKQVALSCWLTEVS